MEENKISVPDISVILHNFREASKRLLWIAVVLAVLVGCFVGYRTDSRYVPRYSVSAVFSVSDNYSSVTDVLSYSTYLNIAAASALASSFDYIIGSDNTQALLKRTLGVKTINATVAATATADAALLTVTTRSSNAQTAYDVLLAVVDVYPVAAAPVIGDTQIQIINLPLEPPTEPYTQNTALSDGLAAAGIVIALGLACIFALSFSRKTVHSAEDLRKLVNLRCLAYIPFVRQKRRTNRKSFHLLITNPRIDSVFVESVRNLRTKLIKQMAKEDVHVLMVTSTLPNEGKTTVATNLALSLAKEGRRVVLVDGDLRKQALKSALGLNTPSDGLIEMLSGTSKSFRLLTVPDSTLLLLSGDETVDNPQALLDSERMQRLITLLRSKLDYIIIDSPPAGILSDSATIAKYVDATLYIVRQDLANSFQIQDSIRSLSATGAGIIGCVLNGTQAGTTRYGYSKKYTGNYAYGYKYANTYYSSPQKESVDPEDL